MYKGVKLCACGCDQQIQWKKHHKTLPDFIHGHNSRIQKPHKKSIPKNQLDLLLKTKSKKEIATQFNITVQTVTRLIRQYGLKNPKYTQSALTRKRRSQSLKNFHEENPEARIEQTRGIRKFSKYRIGKTLEQVYPTRKAKKIRKNISKGHLGKKASDETKLKMSKTRKGRTFSKSWRENISKSRKLGFQSGKIKLSPRAGFGKGGFREDIGHYVRSSYEHVFARWLIHKNISYKYEETRFNLLIDNDIVGYSPDFETDECWYEIKNPYNVTLESFQKILFVFKKTVKKPIYVIVGNNKWTSDADEISKAVEKAKLVTK